MPEILTVVIDNHPVGHIEVESRTPRKVWRRFIPGAGIEPYRAAFEAAVTLAREYDASAPYEPIDYPLWDRLMAAYEVINELKPSLSGVHARIEEFALEADGSVEITLMANGAPESGQTKEACGA